MFLAKLHLKPMPYMPTSKEQERQMRRLPEQSHNQN
jgi:hypothetical protein